MEDYYKTAEIFLSNKDSEFRGGAINEIYVHLSSMRELRERLARGLPRAKRLADQFSVPIVACDPSTGGRFHAYSAILNDDARGFIPDQQKLDLLNETIGSCLELERKELFQIINPVYWLTISITKILRVPFWILETAGFKSESFEKSLAGSVLRLIELLAIICLLLYFGFSESELKEIIKGMVSNV